MPITAQQKLEILKEVGADPDKYWLDDEGNVIDLPKDNSAMAGIKTAALNLPRTAAGVGGAAIGAASAAALGLPTGPGAVAAGLAGGFTGATVGSSLGEMFQNAVYPDSVLMAQQARSVRNPGAVQLGDLAAQAVFMRPSITQTRDAIRGVRALTTMPGFANLRPSQSAALMNMGTGAAVEAGSTMAQGGDLSEILKNAAIGAVFSNPSGITKTMTRGVFSPHVADQGLRDVVNPADLLAKPGEPVVEKPREVNPELLKAFIKQQKTNAKLAEQTAEQLAALKSNREAAAKKAQIDAELGVAAPQTEAVLPQNFNSIEARLAGAQDVDPTLVGRTDVTLPEPVDNQPKPPVILEPGTPGALDQELGIRPTKSFFDWWAQNAAENYRTRMTVGSPTGTRGQAVSGTTEAYRGADGKRDIVIDKNPYTDTAPHELTHGMILDVLQHGKKGEQAEMRRLLKLAGVDEEAFVQGVGEDVVRRFMNKTDDSWRRDFVSFMKYKFGKASPEDVRRIMSNTMLRGGGSKGVSRIVAKPTQEVEEKPPVIPESPRPEVNAEEMAKTYQPAEQPVETPVNEEFNRSMQETRDRMRVEEMNRRNAERVGSVEVPPVEPYVRRTESTQVEPVPVEPIIDDVRGTLEQGAEPTNIEGVRESGELTPEERYAAEDAKIRRLEEEAAALRRRRDFPRAMKQAEGNPASERGERLPGSERRGREREVKRALRSADLENADLSNVGREEVRESTKAEFTNKMKQGRVMAENARESADDLEARRIEARLAGEERPRYQEFGKDRTFATDFEKELAKSVPFKIQVSKDGRLNRNDIKAAVAKLNPTEQEMLKEAGLEQYLTKVARPTNEELMSWAEENLPRVEVKELSADSPTNDIEQKAATLQHELDTRFPGGPTRENLANPEYIKLHEAYAAAALEASRSRQNRANTDNDSATRRFDSANVNPRQLKDMPGAVDLLVRLPTRELTADRAANLMRKQAEGTLTKEEARELAMLPKRGERGYVSDPALYKSRHYPQSGDNLLAHVRAYEHTMPDGERVLRVFELQSDWAQERRKAESHWASRIEQDTEGKYKIKTAVGISPELLRARFNTKDEALQYITDFYRAVTPSHPLLPHHQRLALKAAIEHARKRGIKRVVVDDAETAMMTEGHDRHYNRTVPRDIVEALQRRRVAGELTPNQYHDELEKAAKALPIPQERGMRLAYDNVLQQMMRDLSGDGVKVELGEHRNTQDPNLSSQKRFTNKAEAEAYAGPNGNVIESIFGGEWTAFRKGATRPDLIFRNPDGTPKTQSTGFAYDVSAAQARRDAGEPFSYAGRRYQQFGKDRTLPIREWAKDSVLKSDDGELLPLYHGTKTPGFNSFRTEGAEASGYHYGEGAYFTPDPTRASSYAGAKQKVVDYDSDGNAVYGYDNEQAGGVYKVYTNLRNPFETMSDAGVSDIGYKLSMDNPTEYKALASEVAKKNGYTSGSGVGTTEVGNYYLRKQGYDGVVKRRPNGEVVEVVVFDKNNVKSAFGGDARNINPTSGDVRYQQFGPNRPTSGLADPVGRRDFSPFESASQKAARSDNPVIRTVGRALTELFPAQRAMRGKYRALVEAFANLNEKDKDLLYKILIDEYRAGKPAPGTVPARLRKEYNDVRRTLRQMRDDQIKAGQRNANGVVPGIDDSYFPNVVDPSVRKTLADEIDSPRFKQLKDEFVKFNEANLRSKGATAVKANEEANKLFNRFIGTLNKQPVEGAFDFGAVVLPEASRLPDNWLHSDPAEAMSQYVRDWSRSRAFYDIVQTNEDVMAGLGQEEFFVNGKKTPVKNRVATTAVKDNNILFLLNEAVGIRRGSQDKITGAIGRAASAAWLANPITRSVDIATSLFKGLGMVTPAQIPGLVSNLRNLGKSYERAYDTGWIREDGNTIVGEVLGAGEAFSNGVDKFSKGLSKYTGSEKLENFGRGLSQNIGEYIARTNTALAQSGNKRATDFLDRVAPNWRTLSEAELGTRIGQLFQGRYDATNLPQWLSDSPAAPFFSLARWNIEQWNNFREFAIKPARNGDPVPLISMLVAGIAGGVGIKEIREALSGRKSKIATLKEIAEAPEGSAKYKELVRYYANLAQLSGTIGIVGEIGNMVLDVASKDSPAAPSMPALEVTRDIIPRLIAAGNAMMDGEDPLTVITQVSRDIGNEHVSAYRFLEGMAARTGMSDFAKAELDAANDRRDFRTGKRLRGEPIKAAVQLPIDYSRAEERAMEEERDPVKRRQMALALKAKIKQDPDKDSRERKMRAAATSRPSYLPSIENDPKAFREQLDFVRRTQGEDKVTELKKRYLRDKKNSDSQRKMFNQ